MIRRFVRGKVALAAFGALVAAFALPSDVAAQGTTTGSITGVVVDNGGEPLADATVIVRNTETGSESRLQTNAEGRYRAGLLRPGTYTVRAEFPPLDPVERGPVRVAVGETRSVAFALAPVEMEAIVARLEAEAASIDITQGGVVETINEDQIENLPTIGRDFTDFIALSGLISPQQGIGTGGQFSIGGARTSGTNVTIDGADANNAFFGENRGSSRLPFTFSLESIKEFQIITNGYDVEYGKFSGGQINAVTRGGTNEFDGSFFIFGRNESLTADNFDDSPPTDFSQTQFGGVVSGPIVEDELHFFASGDFQVRDQPVFALDPERARSTPAEIEEFIDILENVYGLPGESQQGQFDETADEAAIFGRIDWTPNQNHRVTLRGNYTSFDNEGDRLSSFGNEAFTMAGKFEDRAFSLVGELNSIVNEAATAYNTLRIHYSDEDRPRFGNSSLPSVTVDTDEGDLGYGGNFFGILFANRLEETKLQITDNLTWQKGNHTLKVGTDNIFSNTTNKFWLNGNGFFTFDTLEDFRNRDPGFSFRFVPAGPDGGPDPNPTAPVGDFNAQEWAFYVQDEWQATDKLLLNFGLRYDTTVFPDEAPQFRFDGFTEDFDEIAAAAGHEGIDISDVPEDRNNFGPRFSFTYDANGDQTSVWRGGAGLFHARIPTVLHGNVLQIAPDPLLAVICIGAAVPEFNYENWQDPDNIPTNCQFDGFQPNPFGIGITGTPQFATWDPDFEMPQTLKMNLGYEQRVGESMKAGIQVLYSRTWNNFHVQDLNLKGEPEFINREGRPVFVEPDEYDPTDEPDESGFGRNDDVNRLFFQTDTGKAEIWNVQLNLQGQPTEGLFVSANYTYNYAFDNTSFVCCTASAGMFDIPTAGNPNFIGDFGDKDEGNWGPSDFERRHVFVANATWKLPANFELGAIYRVQSGNPYTPRMTGDVNQDGDEENDRAFIPDPNNPTRVQFEDADELQAYQAILADEDNECLREAVGTIINRNTCSNPTWHSFDLKVQKSFTTFSGQEIELTLDLFNILDAIGMEAGEFVFEDADLLEAEGLADDGETVTYSVNDDFGRRIPVGFGQLQFQAQLGLRYRF